MVPADDDQLADMVALLGRSYLITDSPFSTVACIAINRSTVRPILWQVINRSGLTSGLTAVAA